MAATAAILDSILTKNNRLLPTTNVDVQSKFQVNLLRNAACIVRTNKKTKKQTYLQTYRRDQHTW